MTAAPLDEARRLINAIHRIARIKHPGPESSLFTARQIGAIEGGTSCLANGATDPFHLTAAANTFEGTAERLEWEAAAARRALAKCVAVPAVPA